MHAINVTVLWICGPEAPIRGFVKKSNLFPVHKKLVWPTDLPKKWGRDLQFISTSCVGFLHESIVCGNWSGSNFKAKMCTVLFAGGLKVLSKMCETGANLILFFKKKLLEKKRCTNDIFIIILVCFEVWSALIKESWLLLMSSFRLQVSPSVIEFWNLA